MRQATRISLEFLAGLLMVFAVVVGVLVWRLGAGPVYVNFVTPYLEKSFAGRVDGVSLTLGKTLLEWVAEDRSVALRVEDVQFLNQAGERLAVIPLMGLELDLSRAVRGEIAPTVLEVIRPQLTVARLENGRFALEGFLVLPSDSSPSKPPLDSSGVSSSAEQKFSVPLQDSAQRDEQQGGAQGGQNVVLGAMMALLEEPRAGLSTLKQISIRSGRVRFDDRQQGVVFFAPRANISVRRERLGLAGNLSLAVVLSDKKLDASAESNPEKPILIEGAFVFDRSLGVVDLALESRDVQVKRFASLLPDRLEPALFTVPLTVNLVSSVKLDGEIGRTRFEVSGGAGQLGQSVPVSALLLKGSYAPQSERLVFDNFAVNFGTAQEPGPKLAIAGNMSDWSGQASLLLSARLLDMAVDDLDSYWPESVIPNARRWITKNIRGGTVTEALVKFALRADKKHVQDPLQEENAQGFADIIHILEQSQLSSLEGELAYEGVSVHYLRPLPPVRNVAGTAALDDKGFTLFVEKGQLVDLQLAPSTVDIQGLGSVQEVMNIHVDLDGPLPTALQVLDHEPLGLISRLNVNPDDTAGLARVAVDFSFPLLRDLRLKDMTIQASADLSDAGFSGVFRDWDVTDGMLKLDVSQTGLELRGPLRLDGHPLSVQWTERFVDLAPEQAKTTLTAAIPKLDSSDLKNLVDLDTAPWVEGPLSLNLLYELFADEKSRVSLVANLEQARLRMEPLNWEKGPGHPATFQAVLGFEQSQLTRIDKAVVRADDLDLAGRVMLDGASVTSAFIDKLTVDQTDLESVRVNFDLLDAGRRPAVTIGGGVLDLRPFITGPALGLSIGPDLTDDQKKADQDSGENSRAFTLHAMALDRLIVGGEHSSSKRWFDNVSLSLDKRVQGWKAMRVRALIPDKFRSPVQDQKTKATQDNPKRADFVLRYQPDEEGVQRLSLEASDLGAFLRVMGVSESVQGGTLRVQGQAQSWQRGAVLSGRLNGENLRFLDAPILARLLSFTSLAGPLKALSGGEGMVFERLDGDFTLKNGVFVSEDLRLYSASLGLTGRGWLDSRSSELDVAGTIVPAYTLNRFLGVIPLFGQILTGGEGIVAFDYAVRGKMDNPNVFLNPLSALTPGILRKILPGGEDAIPAQGVVTQDEEKDAQSLR